MLKGLLMMFGIRSNTIMGEVSGFIAIIAGIVIALINIVIILICCHRRILKHPIKPRKLYKDFSRPVAIALVFFISSFVLLWLDNVVCG